MRNKVVVITGSTGILCSIIAKSLAKKDYKIALLVREMEKAESLRNEIIEAGGIAHIFEADVLKKEALEKARLQITEKLGTCDILINGAGGNHPLGTTSEPYFLQTDLDNNDPNFRTIFDLDPEGIKSVFDLNFLGTFLPTQVFAKDMVGKTGCSVLNISSLSAVTPLTKIPAYSAAKAAASNLTQWLSVHFSKVNIRVNAIAPGFFLTTQNRSLLTTEDGSLTERGQSIISHTPAGRFGNPEDLISSVLFLCDERSSFVTGIVIPVDGGFSAFSGV
ncbi:NAD(P)-dependent dehydrogenase (short-subunit alcohol dehydrogenase family) [Epilithonimonas hungarica]|uniref:SDR family oxidoreductase n=1 Tax=Epilithonimonas hungarica TaxID=454006 RepID=UPI00277F34AC|nr:SDR family oxidoreductase [Epilithonimonas hungarica]MDP9955895.1 NAD(P)-dependent dehydrogenase (short-subunit alcohol dehydrogenase family) [Epilithonimonas hungarica]